MTEIADKVLVIRDGELKMFGPRKEVMARLREIAQTSHQQQTPKIQQANRK